MSGRKRKLQETEIESTPRPSETVPGTLRRLRNMWEFASLMQYLYLFGKVVKVGDDLDIDVRALAKLIRDLFAIASKVTSAKWPVGARAGMREASTV